MNGVNKVILVGSLGRDPEIRTLQNGSSVVNMALATSEEWKDKATGNKTSKTEWHKIVMYRQLAELAAKYLSKGSLVYIEGKIQSRSFQDKDGVERHVTEIIADRMQFLGGGSRTGQNSADDPTFQKKGYGGNISTPQHPSTDDDVPF